MKIILLFLIVCNNILGLYYLKPGTTIPLSGCLSSGGSGELVTFTTTSGGGGGHEATNHDVSARPRGSFSGFGSATTIGVYTGVDGCAHVTWVAPIFSGFYDISAYGGGGSDLSNLLVYTQADGGDLLLPLAVAPSSYQLIGMTPPHPQNHYGTTDAITKLGVIIGAFRGSTGLLPSVNDMSLIYGGKFDFVVGSSSSGCWTDTVSCGHQEHRLGTNADISFASLGTVTQRALFKTMAEAGGGDGGGPIVVHADHFHLRF
ncbi:hypothetical protein [Bryobacter aggregatus]|uniref:hypothetical protein n=1 Tax=Bryobacter aggregatus TaxID=360054 RepID=UPI0012BA5F89|nr:hypothetical protein [Bryobacter aggregatus]